MILYLSFEIIKVQLLLIRGQVECGYCLYSGLGFII